MTHPPSSAQRLQRPHHPQRLLLAAVLAVLLGGCAISEPARSPLMSLPDAWDNQNEQQQAVSAATAEIDPQWWQQFASPTLDALIDTAFQQAPSLLIQTERVFQAELALRQAGASLLPSLSLSAGSGSQKSGGRSADSSSAGLSARYEIDLWGKLAAQRTASSANFAASRFDHDAAQLSLSANIANLWFQALTLEERLRIARANLDIAGRVLKIVEARYRQGAASALEVSQQQSTVLTQQKAIDPLEVSLQQTHSALAILLGEMPQHRFGHQEKLTDLQLPTIDAGLPASLLLRRPDLAASEARLEAAAANISAARAELLPSISLSAGASAASAELLSLAGHASTLSLSASLLQTIFDGGRLRNEVEAQRSRQRELMETYRQTVLTALKEVEDALGDSARDQAQESLQREILSEAERSLRLAELRYREGADNLLAVLDAQRSLFSAQDQLAQLRLTRLNNAVALYRVLGGGWDKTSSTGKIASSPPPGQS